MLTAMATSRRNFIAAMPWMLLLAGCKDFEKGEGQHIDRSKISDPEVLTCVAHVEGYIDACYSWEKGLPRKSVPLPENLPNGIRRFVDQAGGRSVPDFKVAKERFKTIAEGFWTGAEWKMELGSFSTRKLKHDPNDEWPISAERLTDSAIEVVVSIPDFMDRSRTQRIYRLEKVSLPNADASSTAATKPPWRIRTIFNLDQTSFPSTTVPAPPAKLTTPARPQIPAGASAVSTGPVKTTIRLRPYPDPKVSALSNNIGGPFLFQ